MRSIFDYALRQMLNDLITTWAFDIKLSLWQLSNPLIFKKKRELKGSFIKEKIKNQNFKNYNHPLTPDITHIILESLMMLQRIMSH